jgi:hypothetical protein
MCTLQDLQWKVLLVDRVVSTMESGYCCLKTLFLE